MRELRNNLLRPTDAELEVLALLWKFGPSTVRFLNDKLNEKKPVGYTTTLKIMQIMTGKGILVRETDRRTHIYSATIKEEEVQEHLLDRLVSIAFDGSAQKMVMQALGNHRASAEELNEIKALIKKLEEDKG